MGEWQMEAERERERERERESVCEFLSEKEREVVGDWKNERYSELKSGQITHWIYIERDKGI